jgi:Ca2+-binding EF-hand superfamily protein
MIEANLVPFNTFTPLTQLPFHAFPVSYTVAPEIIKGSYDEKSDIWSIGVITYLLLSGETPFGGVDGEDLRVVRDKILEARLLFQPTEVWENVSNVAKSFVRLCLQPDIKLRPTAKEAQRDMWIQTYSNKKTGEGANRLKANVVKALVQFKEYSDMRKLLCEVLSFTLLPEQIADLRKEFEKLDNGDGEISLADLKLVLLETAEAGSLGALTELEVEDIFDALRVRKSETKIRWHEFIAAGLSQCKVDERNLTLAFDRLDTDRKGFITFGNVMDMLGDSCENRDDLWHMWMESIRHVNGHMDKISLDQFLIIMKGQALSDPSVSTRRLVMDNHKSINQSLASVLEGTQSPQSNRSASDINRFEGSSEFSTPCIPTLEDGPTTDGGVPLPVICDSEESSPDYLRLRSRSLETIRTNYFADMDLESDAQEEPSRKPVRPNILMNGRSSRELEKVVKDESMTPLMVNRALYRAHRELRLAVLDASKRFEEKQQSRTDEHLMPALVMRRGSAERESTPAPATKIEDFTEAILNNASQRGGRPNRGTRKKTVSDMTGFLTTGL